MALEESSSGGVALGGRKPSSRGNETVHGEEGGVEASWAS